MALVDERKRIDYNNACFENFVLERKYFATLYRSYKNFTGLVFSERSSNIYPDTGALWLPFQTAAGTVTTLYKGDGRY